MGLCAFIDRIWFQGLTEPCETSFLPQMAKFLVRCYRHYMTTVSGWWQPSFVLSDLTLFLALDNRSPNQSNDSLRLKQFTMTGSCGNDSARNFNCSESSRFRLSSSCQEAGFEPSLRTARSLTLSTNLSCFHQNQLMVVRLMPKKRLARNSGKS